MSADIRPARLVEHDGVSYAVGGVWTAGGSQTAKPKSLVKLAREESFDPKTSSAAWLAQEGQTGFFVWDGGPPKVKGRIYPLAARAARQVPARQHPFVGIFNLGDGLWWIFGTDGNGAIHPVWGDVFGSQEEIEDYSLERAGLLASAARREEFFDPGDAWAWLYASDIEVEPLRPVQGGLENPRVVRATVGVALLGVAAIVGGKAYQSHQQSVQAEAARQAQIAAAKIAEMARLDEARKLDEARARVQAFWASYPRPWEQPHAGWADVLGACRIGPLTNGKGWTLENVQCQASGSTLQISRSWSRGRFARVLDAPGGKPDPSGDRAATMEGVQLSAGGAPVTLEDADEVALRWLDTTKRLGGAVVQIQPGTMTAFRPPYPPNTPPEIQKEMQPPVLWKQMEVSLIFSFQPKVAQQLLEAVAFLPAQIDASVASAGNITNPKWAVKGVQYAAP